MSRSRANSLSCGGKGPCCHVGYAHRHCEHCDMVIATAPAYVYPWINPVYPRPWQPYWGTWQTAGGGSQIGNNFGNVGNAAGFAQALEASWKTTAADSSLNVKALPDPTAAHLCEVK